MLMEKLQRLTNYNTMGDIFIVKLHIYNTTIAI